MRWVARATSPFCRATGPTEWRRNLANAPPHFDPRATLIPRGKLPRGTGKLPVPPFRATGVGDLEVDFDPAVSMEEKIIFSKYVHEHLLQHGRDVEGASAAR